MTDSMREVMNPNLGSAVDPDFPHAPADCSRSCTLDGFLVFALHEQQRTKPFFCLFIGIVDITVSRNGS